MSIEEKKIIVKRDGSETITLEINIGWQPHNQSQLSLGKTKELIEILKSSGLKENQVYNRELKF